LGEKTTVLQEAKELGLKGGREDFDVLQIECSFMGHPDKAFFLLYSQVVGFRSGSEELFLQKIFGDGRTVYCDDLLIPPGAEFMDGLGADVLARPLLAADQYGVIGEGEAFDLFFDFQDHWVKAHQGLQGRFGGKAQFGVFFPELEVFFLQDDFFLLLFPLGQDRFETLLHRGNHPLGFAGFH
jgi:hypothetical protein